MQLETIETFLDLLETGSFGRTAERLGVTQSTVSDRIRSLEGSIGTVLFVRGRAGAQPNAAGLRFASHARSIKLSWTLARQELGHLERFSGVLRIAAQVTLIDPVLFQWAARLRIAMPDISLHVEADYSPQMITDMMAGMTDIGVVYTPRYLPEIVYEQVLVERFDLVSSSASNLADIDPRRYLRVGYSPAFEAAHAELLPALSRGPLSVGLGALAEQFLKEQGGSAYLPQARAGELVADGFTRVGDAPQLSQPVFAAYNIRKKHDAALRKALAILRSVAGELGPDPAAATP